MMKKHTRVLALGLTCTALLSLATPAMAARQNTSTTPISASGTTSVTIPSDGTLAFSQIGERVKANNLTLKAAEESLKQALGSEVHVAYKDGKGKLTVHFYSDEQLKAFANLLGRYNQA